VEAKKSWEDQRRRAGGREPRAAQRSSRWRTRGVIDALPVQDVLPILRSPTRPHYRVRVAVDRRCGRPKRTSFRWPGASLHAPGRRHPRRLELTYLILGQLAADSDCSVPSDTGNHVEMLVLSRRLAVLGKASLAEPADRVLVSSLFSTRRTVTSHPQRLHEAPSARLTSDWTATAARPRAPGSRSQGSRRRPAAHLRPRPACPTSRSIRRVNHLMRTRPGSLVRRSRRSHVVQPGSPPPHGDRPNALVVGSTGAVGLPLGAQVSTTGRPQSRQGPPNPAT
jgi:hypothetical protein